MQCRRSPSSHSDRPEEKDNETKRNDKIYNISIKRNKIRGLGEIEAEGKGEGRKGDEFQKIVSGPKSQEKQSNDVKHEIFINKIIII